ncbi:MAG: hypothetical protein V1777_02020 [Candidatus Micrarchaeota archaeon]
MLMKKITAVEFNVLSPEMIRKMSAMEVKTPETYDKDGYPMEGGLMDPHLGVINPGLRCKTCGQKMKDCPGHFGGLELVRPVIHAEFGKRVEDLMQTTCQHCGRIPISDDKLEEARPLAKKDSGDVFKKILAKTKKIKTCPHCKTERLAVMLDKPTNFYVNNERIYPSQIREWIEKIPEKDLQLLGYKTDLVRPEWFILTVMPIPPITIRPSITLESGLKSEDDLTHKLVDIIRINQRLKDNIEAGAPQLIIEDLWDLLQYHVTTYFDNNTAGVPPAKHRSGRALRTIVQRLKGKKGRFRHNLTGKRVNFAARSSISPDPFISINEVGVPQAIAKDLTVQEYVTDWNKKSIGDLIKKTDKVIYLVRPTGARKRITDANKDEAVAELDIGFKIERELMDGDIVLFNRQPSLHRLSMMAHYARIMPGKTFRINPIVCVSGETQVSLDCGTPVPIKELENNWVQEEIETCNQNDGRVLTTELERFWAVSPKKLGKKCYKITTQETQRCVQVTGDHPFYTENGIETAEQLALGRRVMVQPSDYPPLQKTGQILFTEKDMVALCPKKTYVKSLVKKIKEKQLFDLTLDNPKSRVLARLLGHLLGDGTFIMKKWVARAIFRGEESDLQEIQKDIQRLGFQTEKIKTVRNRVSIHSAKQGMLTFEGEGSFFEVRNKALCSVLLLLGAPNGDKVTQETRIPEWILRAPLFIKREFLAAYFGCELLTPKARTKNPTGFLTPTFKFAKINPRHATPLLADFEKALKDFDISIASVYQEKGNVRKDGAISRIYSVKLSVRNDNLLRLFGRIGAIYCKEKGKKMKLAFEYLLVKQKAIGERKELFQQVHGMRKQKVPFREIELRTGISIKMLERWMYFNKNSAGLPTSFPSFEDWKKNSTVGLENTGLVWETIEKIEEIELPLAFDITTRNETHNFFANGFLTGNCKPYNADFDGDEMNLHVPQTEEGKTEARELMIVQKNIISPRYGAPVISFEEDLISGSFLLTLPQTKIEPKQMMQYLYEIGITELPKPEKGKTYNGRELYSLLLPKDLNMKYSSFTYNMLKKAELMDEDEPKDEYKTRMEIKNGEIIAGILDAESFGEGRGRIIDWIARKHTGEFLADFYYKSSRIALEAITLKGLTVGLDEYETSKSVERIRQKAIEDSFEEAKKTVEKYKRETLEHLPGRTAQESFEIYMMQIGQKAKQKVERQVLQERIKELLESEKPNYNSIVMILAKSRGNPTNLTNISGMWGQAAVREGRPKRGFRGRLITANKRNDQGILAGGFIRQNFMEGMKSREFFYHAMGGRQGEVDTGVATKVSGYLYRRLANSLKDLVVANDQTVRTASNTLVQFVYGEDNVFPANTQRGKSVNLREFS